MLGGLSNIASSRNARGFGVRFHVPQLGILFRIAWRWWRRTTPLILFVWHGDLLLLVALALWVCALLHVSKLDYPLRVRRRRGRRRTRRFLLFSFSVRGLVGIVRLLVICHFSSPSCDRHRSRRKSTLVESRPLPLGQRLALPVASALAAGAVGIPVSADSAPACCHPPFFLPPCCRGARCSGTSVVDSSMARGLAVAFGSTGVACGGGTEADAWATGCGGVGLGVLSSAILLPPVLRRDGANRLPILGKSHPANFR